MKQIILNEVSRIDCPDLLIQPDIPGKKLTNACAFYPVDPADTVLALIDGTVFGSAKQGMALGVKGIYWRNDWTTETARNFLSWDEVAQYLPAMRAKAFDLELGACCVVNLASSGVKPPVLRLLLERIVTARANAGEDAGPALEEAPASVPAPEQFKQGERSAQQASVPDQDPIPVSTLAPTPRPTRPFDPSAATWPPRPPHLSSSLRLVKHLSGPYRFSGRVELAPDIMPAALRAVHKETGRAVEPGSILLVVDNSYLRNHNSWVAVTDQGAILSKSLAGFEHVPFADLHSIGHEGTSLLVNQGELQDLDEFKPFAVAALSEFLNELVPELMSGQEQDLWKWQPPAVWIDPTIEAIVARAPVLFMQTLQEHGEAPPEGSMDGVISVMTSLLGVIGWLAHHDEASPAHLPAIMDAGKSGHALSVQILAFAAILALMCKAMARAPYSEDERMVTKALFGMYIESLVAAALESGIRLCANDKEAFFGFLHDLIENDEKLDLRKVRAIMPFAGSDELQGIWRLVESAWPTAVRVWAIWM